MTAFQGKIPPQAWMTAPETVQIMTALQAPGHESRFVGGCVRDTLANRRVIDIDIATTLRPEQVIDALTAAKIHHVPTGLQHGTITAIVDGKPFEITTLRIDRHTDGRHAEVRFTDDWKKDAERRDFTINTLSMTMDGDIYDPFDGIAHLREGRVMFVGDPEKRIAEDYLRILRYFRFLAQFGTSGVDDAALDACANHAKNITRLSAERVRQETLRILESDRAADVWELMILHRVATHFLPEAMNVKVLKKLAVLEKRFQCAGSGMRRLAALLAIDMTDIPAISSALRLSNEQTVRLIAMKTPLPLSDIKGPEAARHIRRYVHQRGADAVRSLLLLAEAAGGAIPNLDELFTIATQFRVKPLPIEGKDILALGIPPGPRVGQILRAVEDWWISEDFQPGRTACLEKLSALIATEKK